MPCCSDEDREHSQPEKVLMTGWCLIAIVPEVILMKESK